MADQVVLNNRYRILHQIGEGGMAKVYKAEDNLLERTVAVKVLREQYASDQTFLDRFRQEARSAAALAHPNVVSVYDVGVDGNWNYIVMEFVDGPSLKDLIVQGAPFSTARAIEITSQILSALTHAHQKSLVHRDVKPQNILISVDGNAKVTDFGIARAATTSQLTETGFVFGSVHYFAPEQAKGEPATPASDIYSVGIVMYEMLTGHLPFEGDSTLGIALKHVQDEAQPPTRLNPRIPYPVEQIILKAMAKDPAQRYPSAESIKRVLISYQHSGDQMTAPVKIAQVHSASTSVNTPAATAAARSVEKRGGCVDWFVVILAIIIVGLLAAAVPLGYRVYQLYMVPQTVPTAGAAAPVSPTVEPTQTSTPEPTATSTAVPLPLVPAVLGKTFEEARRELEGAGLRIRRAREEPSERYERSRVISQSVEAGREAQPGTTIDLVVSSGPPRIALPPLVNAKLSDAVAELDSLQLRIEVKEDWHETVPLGSVIGQKPEAEALVEKGATVVLTVSRGPRESRKDKDSQMVAVPLVVGLPEKDARIQVERSGLNNTYPNMQGRGDIPDADLNKVPVGHVLSQTPAAGAMVPRGTTVNMAVRKN